ncbi:MAG: transposase, partial [Planctomycetales bacterium]|nr:transposase [Planctomycetales bacterium]
FSVLLKSYGLLRKVSQNSSNRFPGNEGFQPDWSVRVLLAFLDTQMHDVLSTDKIAEARSYILNQWDGLQKHVFDGHVPIDNNHCEQLMKQVALGRKNWLFLGSVGSGYRTANLLTIVSSAVRNDLDVAAYLEDILRQLLVGTSDLCEAEIGGWWSNPPAGKIFGISWWFFLVMPLDTALFKVIDQTPWVGIAHFLIQPEKIEMHKLTSSQAHKLTSSQAHKLNSVRSDYCGDSGFDVVCGSRCLMAGRRDRGCNWNYLAIDLLSQVLFVRHRLRLTIPAACCRLFDRKKLPSVATLSQSSERYRELNRVVAEQTWWIIEVPISYRSGLKSEGNKICACDFWPAVRTLLSASRIVLFALLASVAAIAGCDQASRASGNATSSESLVPVSSDGIVWDCGVVPAGETTRVAFPLDLPGVTSANQIVEVKTSCECTDVTLREFASEGRSLLVACVAIDRTGEASSPREQRLQIAISFSASTGESYENFIRVTLL